MVIDQATFERIYDDLAPKIFKFCYFRVSSKEEAEDIASHVFLRAWDHVAGGKEVANIQGFLYRIANNLVIDYYRKNKDKRELSLNDPKNPIDVPDKAEFVERIDQQMLVNQVQDVLRDLQDNYKEIVVMRFVNDLSIKEISYILGTSENNISVRLHRALDKLKSLI